MIAKIQTFLFLCLVSLTLIVNAENAKKEIGVIRAKSIALLGTPAYPNDYPHWNYVNPNAPKGGEIRLSGNGSFDSFNRYASRGRAPQGAEYLFDRLMIANDDEIYSLYSFIAESIEYASDFSWVVFHIHPDARFQDGSSIRTTDVAFSFDKFITEGRPQYRKKYKGITYQVIDEHQVKFFIPEPNKQKMMGIARLIVLPEKHFSKIKLDKPLNTVPVGSGAYTITDFKMGHFVTYQRVENYWAKDHPARRGTMNFDRIRYDYYLDETVKLESFKKGDFDFREEYNAKNWNTQLVGRNFDNGNIVKEEINHSIPKKTLAFTFNHQRKMFQDARVREAIGLMFDFEWSNENLFYSTYQRNDTYFINTPYKATGLPSGREREILLNYKNSLPPELFTKPPIMPKTGGDGHIRKQMRKAVRLLKLAGYQLKQGKMFDPQGEPFEFEIIFTLASQERYITPFKNNLERIGITVNLRLLSDVSQYLSLVRKHNYDMTTRSLGGNPYPNANMLTQWHSRFIDSSYNPSALSDPIIDDLLEQIEENLENEKELLALGRAFDRILLWKYIAIPLFHTSSFRIAYWNKFSRPTTSPKNNLGMDTWWFDEKKLQQLLTKN